MLKVVIVSLLVFTVALFATSFLVRKFSKKDTSEVKIITRSILYFLFILPFIGGVVFYWILSYANPAGAVYQFEKGNVVSLNIKTNDLNTSEYVITYRVDNLEQNITLVNPIVSYGAFEAGEERVGFYKCTSPREVLFKANKDGDVVLKKTADKCLIPSHTGQLYLDYSRKK